jgi:hypothetical protein
MRPTKHRATVIFLSITTCIILTAGLLVTNAPAALRLTSSPVQLAALETRTQSTLPNANRFRLAQNTCESDDGKAKCSCPPRGHSDQQYCCKTTTTCFCSASGVC